MPKTNAECVREHRARKRAAQNKIKKTAMTSTERVRKFRAKQKALKVISAVENVESATSDVSYIQNAGNNSKLCICVNKRMPNEKKGCQRCECVSPKAKRKKSKNETEDEEVVCEACKSDSEETPEKAEHTEVQTITEQTSTEQNSVIEENINITCEIDSDASKKECDDVQEKTMLEVNDVHDDEENNSIKDEMKNRVKKRKREDSESSTEGDESEAILSENSLIMEKNIHALAVKNNIDDIGVRKILKKVVTNDHVLALVKLREEEEESGADKGNVKPKLTRAKVKELMKVSPKSAQWSLENLELTPIKHIPVKTRPEVKALIAQELTEDEDDEEYEPTHDDVASDDDQTLESCSDLDSQPRTPATPRQLVTCSPVVVRDGPFKVPQDISTPTRRKLQVEEEEATIALRTRSKLCLSETPIEHIESSFVPPDELPPVVDDLWKEFLQNCLDPGPSNKTEDDDEADPEYNVAADPDAHEEDEEALEGTIIKISKKELNDLMTELFNIMPEAAADNELIENLTNNMLSSNETTLSPTLNDSKPWLGKQEVLSDSEEQNRPLEEVTVTVKVERIESLSTANTEGVDCNDDVTESRNSGKSASESHICQGNHVDIDNAPETQKQNNVPRTPPTIYMQHRIEARPPDPPIAPAPPSLRNILNDISTTIEIPVHSGVTVLPQQLLILQQQLRQHVQISTSTFLQLYVHPESWTLAPTYKEYLESFMKLLESNPKSVVNVCNLKPAWELMDSWEKSMSQNTPENKKVVEYIQKQLDRCRRRAAQNSLYVGDFHDTFKNTIANSTVFLYPHLLPSMPLRSETWIRRYHYLRSEDELITLGLDMFWQYVEDNPELYKLPPKLNTRARWGLALTVDLVSKHMMPFLSTKSLLSHIHHIRRAGDENHPIVKFFTNREVTRVEHRLLPYNPALTLYDQPANEMPRIWVRHLAKTSTRFKKYLRPPKYKDKMGQTPSGVVVDFDKSIEVPKKKPLPIQFTQEIKRFSAPDPTISPIAISNIDTPTNEPQKNIYTCVSTNMGTILVPIILKTNSTASEKAEVIKTVVTSQDRNLNSNDSHCTCCVLLRKICKTRQTAITEYFKSKHKNETCACHKKKYPKISNRLRIFLRFYKTKSANLLREINWKLNTTETDKTDDDISETDSSTQMEDLEFATDFHLKLTTRLSIAKKTKMKHNVYHILHRFNVNTDDPVILSESLYKAFDVELVDMYKEFLGFLTAEQAEKIGKFKDYFVNYCISGLMRKVEVLVSDKSKIKDILVLLSNVFTEKVTNTCCLCTELMAKMFDYPQLAEYTFSLFPHMKMKRCEEEELNPVAGETLNEEELSEDASRAAESYAERGARDYEADHSSSGEDNEEENNGEYNNEDEQSDSEPSNDDTTTAVMESRAEHEPVDGDTVAESKNNVSVTVNTVTCANGVLIIGAVKHEESNSNSTIDTPELTISKTEIQSESNMSMTIVSDEELVKSEPIEWKRDDDKLILETLKQYLTPEEIKNKTIIEIIEEKHVLSMISDSLTHKSLQDIRERVLYLLQMLVLES